MKQLNKNASNGKNISQLISDIGSIAGIKVDTGAKQLAGSPEEENY